MSQLDRDVFAAIKVSISMNLKVKFGLTALAVSSAIVPFLGKMLPAEACNNEWCRTTDHVVHSFPSGKQLDEFITPVPGGQNVFVEYEGEVVAEGKHSIDHAVEYDGSIILAMSNGRIYRDGLYRNPPMLTGGGHLYTGKYKALSMRACDDGVYTLFTNNVWYHSRDGKNLGGGGRTIRVKRAGC